MALALHTVSQLKGGGGGGGEEGSERGKEGRKAVEKEEKEEACVDVYSKHAYMYTGAMFHHSKSSRE